MASPPAEVAGLAPLEFETEPDSETGHRRALTEHGRLAIGPAITNECSLAGQFAVTSRIPAA